MLQLGCGSSGSLGHFPAGPRAVEVLREGLGETIMFLLPLLLFLLSPPLPAQDGGWGAGWGAGWMGML